MTPLERYICDPHKASTASSYFFYYCHYYNSNMGLSAAQYYALVITSTVSSILSCAGSCSVTISSYREIQSIYQRLVLSLSIADAIGSLTNIFHPFLLPRYVRDYGLLWASGNASTCSAMGFFFALCPALVSFFSLYLSSFFFLKVRYNTQDRIIQRRYLLPGNIVAVTSCLGIALVGVAIRGYAPRVYHNICNFGDCVIGYVDECEQETGLSWYLGWIHVALIVVPGLVALCLTIAVYFSVRAKLKASRRYHFQGADMQTNDDKLKATRTQAILYCLAYWNSFFWYLVFGIVGGDDKIMVEKEGTPPYFAMQLLAWMFFPLQGFVNFLVYTRPRYLQWRKIETDSRIRALRQAVSLQPISATAHVRSNISKQSKSTRSGLSKTASGLSRASSGLSIVRPPKVIVANEQESSATGETSERKGDSERTVDAA